MFGLRSRGSLEFEFDKGAKQSKAKRLSDDVQRMLDPSYNQTSYEQQQSRPYRAYLGADGELHDPDYRDFPVIQQRPRSPWDAEPQTDDDELPEVVDFITQYYAMYPDSSAANRRPTSSRKPRTGPSSYNSYNSYGSSRLSSSYTPAYYYVSPSASNYYSPSPSPDLPIVGTSPVSDCTSSSPSSSVLSSDCDESPKRRNPLSALKRKRRRSSGTTSVREHEEQRSKLARHAQSEYGSHKSNDFGNVRFVDVVEEVEEKEETRQEIDEECEDDDEEQRPKYVPTYKDHIRSIWVGVQLRVQYKIYYAEKGLKQKMQKIRRVHSLSI